MNYVVYLLLAPVKDKMYTGRYASSTNGQQMESLKETWLAKAQEKEEMMIASRICIWPLSRGPSTN